MFGKLTPDELGKLSFKKGKDWTDNPFLKNDDPEDNRWWLWRQGWRRAQLDVIIENEGTCAGEHARDDLQDKICDIGKMGSWTSLDPGYNIVQCNTCGEIWSLEWGGYSHETNMEIARKPEFGHSFPEHSTSCANCGVDDSPTITTSCINKSGDPSLTKWLNAKEWLRLKICESDRAGKELYRAESELVEQPCPNIHACNSKCPICSGRGVIGKGIVKEKESGIEIEK